MTRTRYKTKTPGIYYREDAQGVRRYIVWWRDGLGNPHTSTMPVGTTFEDAKAYKAQLIQRRPVPTKKTMATLLDEWLELRRGNVSENTFTVYTWAVERLKLDLGDAKVVKIGADDIVGLRNKWVGEGLKKQSIGNLEIALRGALASAARNEMIQVSPYTKLLPHERVRADGKKMRCLSSEEIEKLLEHAGEWRTFFTVLITTGLRFGEAAALTWDDIDFKNELVHVRAEDDGARKTANARRSVMLIAATGSLLRRFKLQSEPGPQVFRTSHSRANKALAKICEAAGIERCTPHTLRHTFASILINNRETPVFVCSQMGHANPHVTYSIYAHLFDAQDRVDEARERLQAAIGGLV